MEKKVYTHFGLLWKNRLGKLIIALAIFFALITVYQYFFDAIQVKNYLNFGLFTLGYVLVFIYLSLNVVEISDSGIKTYGLFHKEKHFSWDEIKTAGLAINQFGVVTEIEDVHGSKKGLPKIYLSKKIPQKVDYDFIYKNHQTTNIPFRQDVFDLILERLKQNTIKP